MKVTSQGQAASKVRLGENITRSTSLITGTQDLEKLYSFKDFPVFIGCATTDATSDLREDMDFDICKKTGFIQLRNLLPLEIVYAEYHSEGLGEVWKQHHLELAKFITDFKPGSVLEIGGANGTLAKNALSLRPSMKWTIIEPTPETESSDENLTIIKGFFDEKFKLSTPVDTVVHSHVLEHLYDPFSALKNIFSFLNSDGRHIFSVPNLELWLKNKAPNTLNFEHTVFLTEYLIDNILPEYGFKILKKQHYRDHSIFYATEKTTPEKVLFKNKYEEYKRLFLDFVDYHDTEVKRLNEAISKFDGRVFLFGAHIFSQFLLQRGLDPKCIECILDNSKIKQDKRLYGTNLYVKDPVILKEAKTAGVILKAGVYTEEVKAQFAKLNPNIIYLGQ